MCTDITRIIELEKLNKAMRAQFFASIAHELRTPLNSMIPILQIVLKMLLKGDLNLDVAKLLRLVKIVHNSSQHLEHVIDDALDMSRLENNKFEIMKANFDLREALGEVYDLMKFQVDEKKLEFKLEVHTKVPKMIYSDKKRIKQVLFNIVGNALKFTFKGGILL